MWSARNLKPFKIFADFYYPSRKRRERIRDFFSIIWKTSKLFIGNSTEEKDQYARRTESLFSEDEKIQIIEQQIYHSINMGKLA